MGADGFTLVLGRILAGLPLNGLDCLVFALFLAA